MAKIIPVAAPEYDVCLWPIDPACKTEEWNALNEVDQRRALALASSTLRRLTGYRVGGCPVTIRPAGGPARRSTALCGVLGYLALAGRPTSTWRASGSTPAAAPATALAGRCARSRSLARSGNSSPSRSAPRTSLIRSSSRVTGSSTSGPATAPSRPART